MIVIPIETNTYECLLRQLQADLIHKLKVTAPIDLGPLFYRRNIYIFVGIEKYKIITLLKLVNFSLHCYNIILHSLS